MKSFVNWNEKKQKKYTTSSTYNKNFKTDDGAIQATKKQNNHNQKTVSILDIANLQMKITHQIQKAREKDYYQKNPYELTPKEEQERRITRIKREEVWGRLLKKDPPKHFSMRFFDFSWFIRGISLLLFLILTFFVLITHFNIETPFHSAIIRLLK